MRLQLALCLAAILATACREPEVDVAPPSEELPPPVGGKCSTDRHCAYEDHCFKTGCGLAPAKKSGRVKCEEGYMGPPKRCVCERAKCVELVAASATTPGK